MIRSDSSENEKVLIFFTITHAQNSLELFRFLTYALGCYMLLTELLIYYRKRLAIFL